MIVFDLDGTLSDAKHRRHFVRVAPPGEACPAVQGPHANGGTDGLCLNDCGARVRPDWRAFQLASAYDKPIQPVVDVLVALSELHPPYEIRIWTGREAEYAGITKAWLSRFVSPIWPSFVSLRMRPTGDNTPDQDLKERWLDEAMSSGLRVRYTFDDRNRVVAMWRRRGVRCFQVAEGNF